MDKKDAGEETGYAETAPTTGVAIPDEEFDQYIEDVAVMERGWREEGLGYLSSRHLMLDVLLGIKDKDMMFTIGQLERLFSLTLQE